MTSYVEEVTILGRAYGIEDHEDGRPKSEHFFGHEYTKGTRQRFQCWSGGSGIGGASSIEEARIKLVTSAARDLDQKKREAQSDLCDVEEGRKELAKFMRGSVGENTAKVVMDVVNARSAEAPMAKLDDAAPMPERALVTLRIRASWKSAMSRGGMRYGEIVGYTTIANHPAAIIRENNRLTTIYLGDIVDTQFI